MSALDHMTDDDLRLLVAAARMQYRNRRGRAPRLLRAILKYNIYGRTPGTTAKEGETCEPIPSS